ncbi:MAG: hypothetical protein LUH18_03005 [Oscillospiraceae bacterium]|nr:hypothetical protein [Oscillospiraceae bacterium]
MKSSLDYAGDMFRLYAASGCPTYESEKERLQAEAVTKYPDSPELADMAFQKSLPYLSDILAVEQTFDFFRRENKEYKIDVVKAVYFVRPKDDLHKGGISERVIAFASSCPCDIGTAYRWLRDAKQICAGFRGLRLIDTKGNIKR